MSHPVEETLLQYRFGTLDAETSAHVGEHLRTCSVVFTDIDSAASGVTETLAPAAPPVTSVLMLCSAVAFRPRSLPPLRRAWSPSSATVVFTATLSPTEAPTPTLALSPSILTSAPALTVLVVAFCASIRTSPAPPAVVAFTLAPAP